MWRWMRALLPTQATQRGLLHSQESFRCSGQWKTWPGVLRTPFLQKCWTPSRKKLGRCPAVSPWCTALAPQLSTGRFSICQNCSAHLPQADALEGGNEWFFPTGAIPKAEVIAPSELLQYFTSSLLVSSIVVMCNSSLHPYILRSSRAGSLPELSLYPWG